MAHFFMESCSSAAAGDGASASSSAAPQPWGTDEGREGIRARRKEGLQAEDSEEDFEPTVCCSACGMDDCLVGAKLCKEQRKLDTYSETINDEIRLGEAGWKDRYYADKYKSEDIAKGGGREKIFQTYVEGLCWVMLYYYSGCASWKWCARCLSMRALRVPHTVATLSPQVLPLPLRPVRE